MRIKGASVPLASRVPIESVLAQLGEAIRMNWAVVVLGEPPAGRLHTIVYGLSPQPALNAAKQVISQGKPLTLNTPQPLISMPIFIHGKVSGALQVSLPSEREFSPNLPVIKLVANLLGYIVERERMGLEVHDGVAQTLASALLYLQILEKVPRLEMPQARQLITKTLALIKQGIKEVRGIMNTLAPITASDAGLIATLRQELKELEREMGCEVEFITEWPQLSPGMEFALYPILHEAITNIKKHARSPKVCIHLHYLPQRLIAEVRDWGVGFNLHQQGMGLFSMRKRAELLGGSFKVTTATGKGTSVIIEIPFKG